MSKKILFLLLLSFATLSHVCPQNERPTIPAVQVSEPPVLDGDLSDACWQQAPSVSDFYFTSDGAQASEPTTAWVCYDQENIYVAFHCRDSQPDKIVTQQKKRGGDIDTDDWVGLDLACYLDRDPIVWFYVSAGGVQVESLESGDVSKIEWKGDWNAASGRVDDGYVVEMAVPFAILQYDPNQTDMGIAFLRHHARTNHTWWSPSVGPTGTSDPEKFYVWKGLKLPRPKVRPQIMGYSLAGVGEGDVPTRLGLDIKHAITPTFTGALTFKPDFRNVEQQVDSVDFTYTEQWLPESRPFFLEGGSYFPGSSLFYPRRIGDIDLGGKIYGKYGDFNLAALHARRFGEEDYTVLSVGHEWPSRATLYLRGVQSNAPGVDNTVAHASAWYNLYDRNDQAIDFTAELSTSASGSSTGKKLDFSLHEHGRPRTLEWSIGYQVIDPDFDPYLGYVPEKDIRVWHVSAELSDHLSKGNMNHWRTELSAAFADRTDGSLYYNSVAFDAHCHWQNATAAYLDLVTSHRPPYHDRMVRMRYRWDADDLYRESNLELALGKRAGGDYLYYSFDRGWLLTDKLSVKGSYEFSRIKPPSPEAYSSSQLIATLAYDIDNERTLAGRLISRKGKSNFYMAYKQRVRSGMDVYVIYGDPNAESTRSSLLLKLIRLL